MIETSHLHESPKNYYDGELKFFYKGLSFDMPFVVKRRVTLTQLPFLQEDLPKEGIIIMEYASKSIKEQLRRLGINYLEISGNAYISYDRIYIFIDTNKRIKLEDTDSNAAFSKTGLKVIYHLLSNKDSINYSYRKLGEISGVSIDTIGRVYRELVRDKYFVKVSNRKYKIIDYDRLFKDWVTLFNKTLRPKLKKRSFRFSNNQSIQSLLAANFNGKISGELAAEKLSSYNIAEKANIYVKGSFVDLAMKLDLRPDKNGQITMIEQFWNDSSDNSERIADLPLVYADLISDPKPRNLETAKLIFNEYAYQSL
ncbi:MAG: hypothetical protein DHS20C18_26290 [Saprospiraceae bacterium]|nr:MAG: hypothetical protein DHS20C18_26290 [Saprospiraceae bacterium]